MRISEYWKGILAAAVPVVLLIQSAINDGEITGDEGVKIGIAIIGAVAVVAKANRPRTPRPPVPPAADQRRTL